MKIHEISLEKISRNNDLRFTSSGFSSELKESISHLGVVNPIYIISKGKQYQILAGFKRFNCALTLRHKTIPAIIVKQKESADFFRNLVLEHLSYHTLNIIEKAKIIQIFNILGIGWKEANKNYLKIIDIPSKKVVKEMVKLLELPRQVQDYIEAYDMSLKQTETFQTFTAEINILFVNLAEELGIRSVELAKLMTFAEDISGNESVAIDDIFKDLEVDSILKDENLSKNQKKQEITQRLQNRKYSKLSDWNHQLEHFQKELNTPEFMHVSWDSSLERPGVTVNIHVKSVHATEAIVDFFSRKKVKKIFRRMLDIV